MDREQSVQHFLDLLKKSRRGNFKIYIGMIAGVGKSYRMLQEAHQLLEVGVPMVIALNMMDLVRKNGDRIDVKKLSEALGCEIIETSALKGEGSGKAAQRAAELARAGVRANLPSVFGGTVEHAIAHIEESLEGKVAPEHLRWYAVKLFERDERVKDQLNLDAGVLAHIEEHIAECEKALDDDAESIITNERYVYIASIIKACYKKSNQGKLSTSDKIDKIVTNRWAALPIFAVVMFLVYYISMVTVGSAATDWANDGLFGDGYHLVGIGASEANKAADEYGDTDAIIEGFLAKANEEGIDTEAAEAAMDQESEDYDSKTAVEEIKAVESKATFKEFGYTLEDEETLETTDETGDIADLDDAVALYDKYEGGVDPADYGVWVPGIPVLVEKGLEKAGAAEWLSGLILDGIVAGVGAVLSFVPQMLVLFLLLAFLEACGYMARIAFVLDRIFRKFGLSGKSFIPMLIGSGCGIPGIMASRTIENERDRRMTIMTTTFIPCGAKVPFIAMIAGAIFGGSAIVATSAYFIGVAAIIISGIMLKKTKMFAGDPAPFVMELPAYHLPTVGNVLRSMWERGWSFIKKAGTIILLSTILVWFTTYFGFADGKFGMLSEDQLDESILATIGGAIAWIFKPLGWGTWQAAVASITGLVAKENIVGTMGILYGGEGTVYSAIAQAFTGISAYSFLVFNLLCAPCFAAIGVIKREMNSAKWTWFAIGYQCGFAYIIALMINQFGLLFTGNVNVVGLIFALLALAGIIYMLVRPYKEATKLSAKVK